MIEWTEKYEQEMEKLQQFGSHLNENGEEHVGPRAEYHGASAHFYQFGHKGNGKVEQQSSPSWYCTGEE